MAEELPEGFVENFLQYVIDNQDKYKDKVLEGIPWEKRRAAQGRSAKLICDGLGGGIFYLWLSNNRIDWLPEEERQNYRNTLYMKDSTFLYLLIGELDPREAYANAEFRFGGELAPYDVEEILRMWERVVSHIFKPFYERVKPK